MNDEQTNGDAPKEEKNKLYVGNLPYSVDDAKLEEMFAALEGAEVTEAKVITDKFNDNRSRGFGFVTLADEDMAKAAVEEMNGKEIDSRELVVNVARPQEKRERRERSFDN